MGWAIFFELPTRFAARGVALVSYFSFGSEGK